MGRWIVEPEYYNTCTCCENAVSEWTIWDTLFDENHRLVATVHSSEQDANFIADAFNKSQENT